MQASCRVTGAKALTTPADGCALLVEQGASRYVVQQEACRQEPAHEGKMALLLYEAVAYRLEPDQLAILVKALSFLQEATKNGGIRAGNHRQIVAQAVTFAQAFPQLDLAAAAIADLRLDRA